MARWLMAHNSYMQEGAVRVYGVQGMYLYAAFRCEMSLACFSILIGVAFLAVSKFHGDVAVVGAIWLALFLFLYVLGVRRYLSAKRFRTIRSDQQ
jgi:hypothetical protein